MKFFVKFVVDLVDYIFWFMAYVGMRLWHLDNEEPDYKNFREFRKKPLFKREYTYFPCFISILITIFLSFIIPEDKSDFAAITMGICLYGIFTAISQMDI